MPQPGVLSPPFLPALLLAKLIFAGNLIAIFKNHPQIRALIRCQCLRCWIIHKLCVEFIEGFLGERLCGRSRWEGVGGGDLRWWYLDNPTVTVAVAGENASEQAGEQ